MAGTFKFELVTPERMLIPVQGDDPRRVTTADAEQVIVPGADGQFTVMAGHAPVLTALRPGVLEIKLTSGLRRVFVRGGFAEVEPDRLTILAQNFVDLDAGESAREKSRSELQSAETWLADAKDDETRMAAQSAVDQLRSFAVA